jgi:hypothetical protein
VFVAGMQDHSNTLLALRTQPASALFKTSMGVSLVLLWDELLLLLPTRRSVLETHSRGQFLRMYIHYLKIALDLFAADMPTPPAELAQCLWDAKRCVCVHVG